MSDWHRCPDCGCSHFIPPSNEPWPEELCAKCYVARLQAEIQKYQSDIDTLNTIILSNAEKHAYQSERIVRLEAELEKR